MRYTLQVKHVTKDEVNTYTLAYANDKIKLFNHLTNIFHNWICSGETYFAIYGFDHEPDADVIDVTDSPRTCNYYHYKPNSRILVETTYKEFFHVEEN